jgi:hypothetical protein
MSITYVLNDNYRMVSMANYVTGHDRPLYFTRPLVQIMGETLLQNQTLVQPSSTDFKDIVEDEPKTKN